MSSKKYINQVKFAKVMVGMATMEEEAGSLVSVLLSQVLAQLYIFHILHSVTFVPDTASQTDTADLAASPDMQCWALNTFG